VTRRRYRRSPLSGVCGGAMLVLMRCGWRLPVAGARQRCSMTVVGEMRRSVCAVIRQQPGRHVPEAHQPVDVFQQPIQELLGGRRPQQVR
jgi:hypothetical protein